MQQAAQGEEKTKQQQCREIRNRFVYPPELQKKVNEWLRYKKEKRQDYQPTGLRRLLAQIQNECAKYGEQAVINVIDMAIANNYQGILWEKVMQNEKSQTSPKQNRFVNYKQRERNWNDIEKLARSEERRVELLKNSSSDFEFALGKDGHILRDENNNPIKIYPNQELPSIVKK